MKAIALIAALLALTAAMLHFGVWQINDPPQTVRGVDVSHYQGDVDWAALASQGMAFAFIKATEGSAYTDDHFTANLNGARDAGMRVGAYHFFSYDSPGTAQAAHFIETVPRWPHMLPPVIDVEFYGDYNAKPAGAADVVPQLRAMVDRLRSFYGINPIIYITGKSYRLYVKDYFDGCDLWIRNVFSVPADGWMFWQYSDRGRLSGYAGDTPFIDLNAFNGDAAQFAAYANERE